MSRLLEGDARERDASAGAVLERRARVRVGVGAAVALVLVALAAAVVAALLTPGGARVEVTPSARADSSGAASAPSGSASGAAAPLYVHVVGAVASPGLYRLAPGARVVDAIAAAGGFAADAEQGSVNLAADLTDGQQLVVAAQGQGAGVGAASGAGSAGAGSGAARGASGGKVDLNTADAAALETLPRVGPAMAQRIIDWREKNGGFRSVEDLLDVTGVGDATFAGLKDLVTV